MLSVFSQLLIVSIFFRKLKRTYILIITETMDLLDNINPDFQNT